MSTKDEYIVQAIDGTFLSRGGWHAEYPDATIYPNLQAARRALLFSAPYKEAGIYTTDDYAMGAEPKVRE